MPEETTQSVEVPIETPTEELVTCERCEEDFSGSDMHYVDNRFGWTDCCLCNSCFEYEMDCEDEEDEIEEERDYKDSDDIGDCPTLTDEEVISSIDTKCTFGLEFETYNNRNNLVKDYARSIGFTYSGDGSIDGNNAVEYQTSILKGKTGAKGVLDFLEVANKNDLKVNESCGTHVHLGALDFFDEFTFKLSDLEKAKDEEKIVIERTLLVNVLEVITDKNELSEWLSDLYMRGQSNQGYSSSYRMKNGKISRFSVVKIHIRGGENERNYVYNYIIRDSQLDKLNLTSDEITQGYKAIILGIKTKNDYNNNNVYVKGEDICIYSRPRSEKYKKLKSLFYTYTLFEKLFFAMLPENRKENTYCNPLSTSYSLRDINNCRSQEDVEKLWYKKMELKDVARCKQNHYEESRYHAFNLHAMFYKYGTVEIRNHHGTLQAHSILMWVAFHQAILKAVLSGKFDFLPNVGRSSLRTVADHYKLMIKTLGIEGTPLQKFIKHRVDKYSPKSLLEIK